MIFIDACFKKPTPTAPIWLMRQAGRYLSEYRATRAKAKNFIDFCRRSDLAAEATLQPIDILDADAAIMFSDILVVPLEMGIQVEFVEKTGPVLPSPIRTESDIDRLADDSADRLEYVYETLKITRRALAADKALIGFAGSPWTLATYMIEGGGSKNYAIAKKMAYSNPDLLHKLLRKLSVAIGDYLLRQIDAGADAVQIFDSWGGALEKSAFFEFDWRYTTQIADRVKSERPNTPVIIFGKGAGGYLEAIDGAFEVFGADWNTPMERAKSALFDRYALQGNMEPARLYDKKAIEIGARELARIMGKENGYIFNLGHGMQPDFSLDNVKFLIDFVRQIFAR
ncbi:MAG: uroporphyrinogen decarboxylase [Helicobacteraceae bacterium]|jgi:uroporphyrinogen decarboxylase|nr:uroporphyrinogen decarboxylase [Helicobacteraceae bacterium]